MGIVEKFLDLPPMKTSRRWSISIVMLDKISDTV